jgi:hypothetical protein
MFVRPRDASAGPFRVFVASDRRRGAVEIAVSEDLIRAWPSGRLHSLLSAFATNYFDGYVAETPDATLQTRITLDPPTADLYARRLGLSGRLSWL